MRAEVEGTFDQARSTCAFKNGAELELAGPISTPAEGSHHIAVVDQRLTDAADKSCFTARVLGVGRTAVATAAGTLVTESKSLLTYRVICPDGSAYADDVPGTCPNFGARWLAKQAPGYLFACSGKKCTGELWGVTSQGPETLLACQ